MTLKMMIILEQSPFWASHTDYWIAGILSILGIGVSAFGLYYSIKAFSEAKLAKNAANQAGIVVKTQEIVMELERISNSCQLDENVNFQQCTVTFNDISARVYGILGMYKSDEEIKEEIQLIQDNLASIKTSLDTANKSNPSSPFNDNAIAPAILENYVYNITAPHFTNLIGSLSKLKGMLNSRLIKNS